MKSVYVKESVIRCAAAILLCVFALALCCAGAGAESVQETGPYMLTEEMLEGAEGSFVCRPVLTGGDSAVCEAVNAAIYEEAFFAGYEETLQTLSPGSTGVRVSWQSNASRDGTCPMVLSILVTADGKQPQGRPGQVKYAMTFDLRDGSRVTFESLCTDEEGMTDFLEEYVWDELEPELSDYMSNCELSPVPVESFWLDGTGNIVFCYDRSRFSFLSGACGAFALRYDEAPEAFDTGKESIPMLAMNDEIKPLSLTVIGCGLEEALRLYRCPLDSFYYASGSAYLTEEPLLRGVYLLTDEDEELVTGVMMLRGADGDMVIGKTVLPETDGNEVRTVSAEESEGLLTVPGFCMDEKKDGLIYTYYFDENRILYGIAIQRP